MTDDSGNGGSLAPMSTWTTTTGSGSGSVWYTTASTSSSTTSTWSTAVTFTHYIADEEGIKEKEPTLEEEFFSRKAPDGKDI